jgi:hypothetical protein
VAWVSDTAAALSRLLQYQRHQQLLLEASALLDVYGSLMQAQVAVTEGFFTAWPLFSAAGLGPMSGITLALLQASKISCPSGPEEQMLVGLAQAYVKLRLHPCVEAAYPQALWLIQNKLPSCDAGGKEGQGDGSDEPLHGASSVPEPLHESCMWSVHAAVGPVEVRQ